ncbi:MAG TPA: type III pantothenate kinase [Spirochaetia bacterium]|nr:type III pantothenate kinase [Spirochaetia bacterium]
MLLAVSVGNSHISFGVHDGSGWRKRFRVQTAREKTPDEYTVVFRELLAFEGIRKESLHSAILSSVVPPLTKAIVETVEAVSGAVPLILSHDIDLGLRITTENPAEVGADLVANAVAAFDRFAGNCIVVDFGTALTFTAVAANPGSTPGGELRGVAIAPGLTSAVDALVRSTSQLPRVPLAAPPLIAGRNTVHSIQSGVVFGYVSLVEGLIRRMRTELGGTADVVVTGGSSPLIAPLLQEEALVEPWLTLEGLRVIAARNISQTSR